MREAWRAIRPTLARITCGERVLLQESEVSEFAARYEAHIALEEQNLLPLARALLGPTKLAAIGTAMSARRTGPRRD